MGTPGDRNVYQISTYSPVGTLRYRNEYRISINSPVGTPWYRNEYQISTYFPTGTTGIYFVLIFFGVLTPLSAIFQLYHGDQF